MSLSKIKYKDFNKSQIDFCNLLDDPIKMFNEWFSMALDIDEENAICFVLSTVSSDFTPSSRVVLLKQFDEQGFIFFTNYNSAKSRDIDENQMVAANFFWHGLEKQVRVVGRAEKISEEESDRYFNSRSRESQLGAWLSYQSKTINFEDSLSDLLQEVDSRFKDIEVPRPSHWGGYRIIPEMMEFWQGKPYRLHDRLVFHLDGDVWKKERLSP